MTTLDLAVRLKDQASGNFDKINKSIDGMNQKLDSAKQRVDAFADRLAGVGTKMTAFVTTPILGMGTAFLTAAAKQEQLDVAFQTMLGSAERAKDLMEDLKTFSAETPFEMPEVVDAGRQLLAYGIEAENVQDTLRMLGDVSSGVGSRIGDLAYLFGTARAQGRLFGSDINQFAGRGIPIIEALAETMGVAQNEVKELVSEGAVGFPELQKAFEFMTAEGSKFGGMMEMQSQTLGGLFSTLKDNATITFTEIGLKLVDTFDLRSKAADALAYIDELRTKLLAFIDANPELIKMGGYFAAIAASIGPLILTLSGVVKAVGLLVPGVQLLGTVFTALTGPIGLVIAGLSALVYFDVGGIQGKFLSLAEAITKVAQNIGEVPAMARDAKDALEWIWTGQADNIDWWWDITDGLVRMGLVGQETGNQLGDALYDAGVKAGEMKEKLDGVLSTIQEKLSEAPTAATEFFAGLSTSVSEFVEKLQSLDVVQETISNVQESFGGFIEEIQALFSSENFSSEVFENLQSTMNSLGATFENLKPIVTALAATIGVVLTIAVNAFSGAIKGLPEIVQAAISQVTATIELIATTLEGTTAIIAALLEGDWAGAWEGAKTVFNGFYEYMETTAENIKTLLAGIIEVVTGAFTQTLDAFGVDVTGMTTAVDSMIGFIKAFEWPKFPEDASALAKWVFPEMPDWLKSFIDWVIPEPPQVLKDLVIWAFPTVPTIITGLVNWTFPTVPTIISTLTSWSFPEPPRIVKSLVEWDFPEPPALLKKLIDFDWPDIPTPGWLSKIPGFGGGNAMGTTYYPGGVTSISERGGEVAVLPGGTRILNARETNNLNHSSGGSGIGSLTVNIFGSVDSTSRVNEFVDTLVNELNRRGKI